MDHHNIKTELNDIYLLKMITINQLIIVINHTVDDMSRFSQTCIFSIFGVVSD